MTSLKNLIAGIIVLYNPTEEVFENIQSYINDIDALYILDNTDTPTPNILEGLRNIEKAKYFSMNGNKGLAYALDYGVKKRLMMASNML